VVYLPYNPALDQASRETGRRGAVHGGVYCLLADTAAWFASARARGRGAWPLTTNLSLDFVGPARGVALQARARMQSSTARVDKVHVEVMDVAASRTVARGTASFAVLRSRAAPNLARAHR
jgi:uncharacterized protein (TIGR00369 family)